MCTFGAVFNGHSMVVPTVYGSVGRNLYFHGAVADRSLVASPDAMVCVAMTRVDGLVLARSTLERGVKYRSAMVYGFPRLASDPEEKLEGLRRLTENATRGRPGHRRSRRPRGAAAGTRAGRGGPVRTSAPASRR
ncbi:pyridoxamine 5'-phosphate oxidase family protein [Streptomyces sp. NPDC101393]|uniref:pyridoxamine 5'-phosphate oxidase family protein n=1 Tax=Streptomyces sp. NPDC101393 TaxID=3366141 RepID=UPI003816029E